MMPQIDVLIPTYDRGPLLAESIKSILRQTHLNFRVLVWDDGSTDGSTDPERLPDDPRIVVLNRGGENQGIPAARNHLLAHIEAPFACWQDSDDISPPDRLTKMLAHIQESGADIAMSYLQFFNGALRKKRWYLYKVDTSKYAVPVEGVPKNFGMHNNMTFATTLFRSELKVFPFDETKVVAEDHAWFRSMIRAGKTFSTLPEPLYFARRHAGRITEQVRKRRNK